MSDATITIRNVPAGVLERLKARARSHRRSMQGEILSILEAAAAETSTRLDAAALYQRIRSIGVTSPDESAAMIREDRDGREGR